MTIFICFYSILCHTKYLTDYIVMGSRKGRGNQYIQLVKVLYCKLLSNGKQLPAFPLEIGSGFELRSQTWVVKVLPLCPTMTIESLRLTFSVKASQANVQKTNLETLHFKLENCLFWQCTVVYIYTNKRGLFIESIILNLRLLPIQHIHLLC